jgi:hypothetical protein
MRLVEAGLGLVALALVGFLGLLALSAPVSPGSTLGGIVGVLGLVLVPLVPVGVVLVQVGMALACRAPAGTWARPLARGFCLAGAVALLLLTGAFLLPSSPLAALLAGGGVLAAGAQGLLFFLFLATVAHAFGRTSLCAQALAALPVSFGAVALASGIALGLGADDRPKTILGLVALANLLVGAVLSAWYFALARAARRAVARP